MSLLRRFMPRCLISCDHPTMTYSRGVTAMSLLRRFMPRCLISCDHPTMAYSKLFNSPDANVVFRSCDGVLFRIHRANLQTNTRGLPPPEISTRGEVVRLTESSLIFRYFSSRRHPTTSREAVPLPEPSATLELLFQYIYPRRHPALDEIVFPDLAALAEAAEKYQVFSAMNICRIRMRDVLPNHAPEVLAYAVRHDYPFLVHKAALLTFDVPLADVAARLPAHVVPSWIKYIEAYTKVLHDAITYFEREHSNSAQVSRCSFWKAERPAIAQHFGRSLQSLRRLDAIFAQGTGTKLSGCCQAAKASWRREIEAAMAEIPAFWDFYVTHPDLSLA
ncbi:hypothetical protein DFH07DRAFT_1056036 [Mycena maculata]|uniref:BTB domain-containing protein n=1 Tax=Mycena maculata TaxID=230809 RepID=A0AAD7NX55_9AGAR|nr:hypothetical protein DFH07DRAFT_1056036 [Mycena maculata]